MPHSKRRRHEIASWWLPALPEVQPRPTNDKDIGEKETAVKNAGRDYHVQQGRTVSSLKEGENWLIVDGRVGNNEPKISIIRRPKHAKSDALNGAMKMKAEAQISEHDGKINSEEPPVLCIDVDNTSKCVAVKDVRDEIDPESNASQLEFFLIRRKRARCPQSDTNDRHPGSKLSKLEGTTCESDEMSSSGYTTDDEKEDAEDLHETTASNKINEQHMDSLPKESDVNSEGSPLYEHPDPLPSRQLRILRDGDRLLMRYTPKTTTVSNNPSSRIAKLEYIYARKKKRQNKEHYRMKAVETTPGKPRLLSVKSDVKSDCLRKFKANDTSAAEAPSDDDDISIKATKDNHKAGKDWSAVDDNVAEAKKENNPSQGGADDEDDGMEEYSYLTGEIVMKDQDYVSALTGDEATILPNPNSNAREENGFWENDAATASAVVVGANDNRATANHRSSSPGRFKKEKEVSFDAKFSPKKTSPKGKGEGSEFKVLDERKVVNSQEQAFFTANTKEEEDVEELSMEEELLSQPSEKDDNNDDDLTDDISQTQPLPEGFDADDNQDDDSHPSLSGVDEAAKEDDDSSTTCAEDQRPPSQVEVASLKKGEVRLSQLTPNSKGSKKDDDSEDEAYHVQTQFESPALKTHESEEEEYIAETQFAPPATILNSHQQEDRSENNTNPGVENDPESNKSANKAAEARLIPDKDAKQEQSKEVGLAAEDADINSSKAQAEKEKDGSLNMPAEETKSSKQIKQSPAKESQSSKRSNDFLPMPHRSSKNAGLLSDDAIHRIQNGAMMTGSVGVANFRGGTDDRDLLTSIALQSTPNLPEAAMSHKSSEETTVVNDKGAKDFTSNPERNSRAQRHLNSSEKKNGSAKRLTGGNKSPTRNPSIPCEVFVETPVKERRSGRSSTTSHQRSKRSRRSLATPSSDAKEDIRIMFTGIDVTSKQKKMIQSIGAELVDTLEKAHTVTHVIATDGKSKLRRTPKLMICLCNTSNILSLDWLEQSALQKQILDPKDFLVLEDKAAETAYDFSMSETLENGKDARHRGGVLAGYSVYICKNVADNNAPPMKALKLIVDAAGGQVIESLSKVDPSKTIILTSDPSTTAQLAEKGVDQIAESGGKVLTTSWLFHTMITQRFSTHKSTTNSQDKMPEQGSKRKQETISEPSSRKRSSRRRSS